MLIMILLSITLNSPIITLGILVVHLLLLLLLLLTALKWSSLLFPSRPPGQNRGYPVGCVPVHFPWKEYKQWKQLLSCRMVNSKWSDSSSTVIVSHFHILLVAVFFSPDRRKYTSVLRVRSHSLMPWQMLQLIISVTSRQDSRSPLYTLLILAARKKDITWIL